MNDPHTAIARLQHEAHLLAQSWQDGKRPAVLTALQDYPRPVGLALVSHVAYALQDGDRLGFIDYLTERAIEELDR